MKKKYFIVTSALILEAIYSQKNQIKAGEKGD